MCGKWNIDKAGDVIVILSPFQGKTVLTFLIGVAAGCHNQQDYHGHEPVQVVGPTQQHRHGDDNQNHKTKGEDGEAARKGSGIALRFSLIS
jgi:hypothetical protein